MTKPRYLKGCSAGSQDRGIALSPAAYSPDDYAWIVNFNNGNSNWNHHDNQYYVRAVRASECQAVPFCDLYAAWRAARAGKRPSREALAFDLHLTDELLQLQERLGNLTWSPGPATCFIATHPKARAIHAPTFADRVVHHYLVPQLEKIWEPVFIHDSYSNRIGKGTHAAVARLRRFVREVHSGQGGGYYLQLDVANFFSSIHRPTLYALLRGPMERAGLPEHVRSAVHALLRHSITEQGVRYACRTSERAAVPSHKRLENAAPGCGIAIGNLSSQFFANVYLNELDQFVKHELRARRYLRYVDDFVLVHHDRAQLQAWQHAIEAFLQEHLLLRLKAGAKLRPIPEGIDFLGYIVRPTHTVVRRRVIGHCRAKLAAFEATPLLDREALRSTWHSYLGHFSHARSHHLVSRLLARFPWITAALAAEATP